MPSYTKIGPAVSDKKISFLYRYINKKKPLPLAAMFFDKS